MSNHTTTDTAAALATAEAHLVAIEELLDADRSLRTNPHIAAANQAAIDAYWVAYEAHHGTR